MPLQEKRIEPIWKRSPKKHGHDTQWIERYMSVEFGEGYHVEVSAREMAEA